MRCGLKAFYQASRCDNRKFYIPILFELSGSSSDPRLFREVGDLTFMNHLGLLHKMAASFIKNLYEFCIKYNSFLFF